MRLAAAIVATLLWFYSCGAPGPAPGPAPGHSAALSWQASAGAVTYNIYRSVGSANSFTKQASGIATLAWKDTNVTAGTTYTYCVTAVAIDGAESPCSADVSTLVP